MFRATLFAALLLTTTVAAQDDGCTEAEPCEWIVTLDASGFDRDGQDELYYNGTLGDWYRFSILNADDVDHTVTLDGYDAWTVTADDIFLDTAPFELTEPGSFALTDDPSGDAATVQVLIGDVVDAENDPASQGGSGSGDGAAGQGAPGFGLVLGLLALAFVARRR